MNYLSFCQSEKTFTSHYVFERYFQNILDIGIDIRYRYIDMQIQNLCLLDFLYRTVKMSLHCLLTWTVLMRCLLSFSSLFLCSLATFKICFFVTCFHQFDCTGGWCDFLYIYSAYGSLSSLGLWVYSFHQVQKNVSYYFFKDFSPIPLLFFPFGTLILHSQTNSHCLTWYWCSVLFSLFFVSCFILNSLYCYSNSLIFSSALSELLLILFKISFISDTFHF